MKTILANLLLIGSLLTNCLTATGSERFSNSASKIDSFGAIACDDAMARLDLFAQELGKDPEAIGYIVVYPERGGLPGTYQSYSDFSRDYLQMTRGISWNRLATVRGEYRTDLTTELWLVPPGSTLPVTPSPAPKESLFGKFDEGFADYGIWEGRQRLSTYDLCPLKAVYFGAFARQLRSEPKSIGRLIIHLERGKPQSRARVMARLLRREMVTDQGVSSDRILIVYGKPRKIPTVELWIQPR